MMMSREQLALAACLLVVLTACAQTPTPTVEMVRRSLVTDTSVALLMDDLVGAYQANHPYVSISVGRAANAERALAGLQTGEYDLAAVAWLPETEKLTSGLWYRPFARDAIVIVTHLTNPVGGLSLLQLRDIFQGQSLTWGDLGGTSTSIIPVSREDGSGTRSSFEALVMGNRGVTPTAVVMPSNAAVVEFVAATPGAIGYVSTAWLSPAVNIIAVEGVAPSAAAVETGRYLLARPFYLVARAEPDGVLAEFVEWASTGQGQQIVRRYYASVP
jgi:phosphate transport system substrate-binding protein